MLRPPDAELFYAAEWDRLVRPCRRCRGTGKLSIPDPADPLSPARRIVRCSCLEEVSVRCRLAEANVPAEFWTVESLKFERSLRELAQVDAYCQDLPRRRREGRGFVFVGENGVGKTSMGCLILSRAVRQGFSAGYLTTQEYLSTIIPADHDPELAHWFRSVQIADFLVLDELGKEVRKIDATQDTASASFSAASLDSLIRQRTQNLLPTIVISNFSAAKVKTTYGASFASAITHRVEYLSFAAADFREEQARRERKERGRRSIEGEE